MVLYLKISASLVLILPVRRRWLLMYNLTHYVPGVDKIYQRNSSLIFKMCPEIFGLSRVNLIIPVTRLLNPFLVAITHLLLTFKM